MKRLILYDLDGTLVDTLEDIAQAANHMLRELREAARPASDVRRYIGHGLHELVRGCLNTADAARIERGVAIYRAYYTAHLVDHSRLYPGAQAVLEHFKARRQAVITNKPNPYARDILRALGVADYFFEVVGGNSAYPKKPHPGSLRAIMERAKIAPQDSVFIGDSPVDVETGRHAGVLTVSVMHGFSDAHEIRAAAPDAMVENFHELLALATREGW
jgi:phosphoglycolate phosphatase